MLLNFPGWIGADELSNFHKQFPDAKIKMSTNIPSSISGVVQLIKNNPGAYDMALGDNSFVGQAKAAGVWQAPDWSLIPNMRTSISVSGLPTPMRCPTTGDSTASPTGRIS